MLIVAFDPGLSGAFAFYCHQKPSFIDVHDMPVADKDIDPAAIARNLAKTQPQIAVVERASARPNQGVSSMFRFGCGYGMVQGVLATLEIPVTFVTPAAWKRHFKLPADKEAARALAIRMWPGSSLFERKKDSGRAEAALIARYAAETMA